MRSFGNLTGVDDGCRCNGSDTLAAPNEAELLIGGRFDGNPVCGNSQHIAKRFCHCCAVWTDLRCFADKGHIDIGDTPTCFTYDIGGVFDKDAGGCTFPLRVGRREMRANITRSSRRKQGVGQRMKSDIGV